MATHSSILAWWIPRTEQPGGLQLVGRQESDITEQLSTHMRAHTHTHTHTHTEAIKSLFQLNPTPRKKKISIWKRRKPSLKK